ncbi:hypothetical protein KQ940_19470 [Marinobacterium sp. D7]|uniref:hypothetical protein n=1 Tax=Marinobacterium ramblicola TaxID=2849041 RepID=UPI001C2D7F10|nr:hypothetical protein [Marinobacterium ramblicola]MBV1790240.1 hypothetical protein [Marinobacterium ramblicola]
MKAAPECWVGRDGAGELASANVAALGMFFYPEKLSRRQPDACGTRLAWMVD